MKTMNPFLVREIRNKEGELHFRRYRLLWTPWFAIYIHRIYKSDQDRHPHDHPWNFRTFILSGSYKEYFIPYSSPVQTDFAKTPFWPCKHFTHKPGSCVKRDARDKHKIELINSPVTTLVLTGERFRDWGYQTEDGWKTNDEYRKWKTS